MAKVLCTKDTETGEIEELAALAIGPGVTAYKKIYTKDVIEKYLNQITKSKCESNHKREAKYLHSLLNFINCEFIGDIRLTDLEKFRSHLLSLGLKNSTVERRFQVINHFFKKCVDWEALHKSPTEKIKSLRIEKNPRKVWSDEAMEKVFSVLSSPFKEYLLFMYLTGARQTEISHLAWTDIDFDQETIKFRSKKNARIARDFPITPEIATVLHNIKMNGNLVFNNNGKTISSDNLYQAVKHRLKALGFNDLTPYGLRHTFANRLSKQGVNAFYTQRLLGHSDIRTTLNYVNPDKKDLKDALTNIKNISLIIAN